MVRKSDLEIVLENSVSSNSQNSETYVYIYSTTMNRGSTIYCRRRWEFSNYLRDGAVSCRMLIGGPSLIAVLATLLRKNFSRTSNWRLETTKVTES